MRGGWKAEDQRAFLRRLHLCGLLAGDLSQRKEWDWFSYFQQPPGGIRPRENSKNSRRLRYLRRSRYLHHYLKK